jgi:hypothetical protein
MAFFGEWFREQVAGENDERRVLADVTSYYATAFEFVVIGAAYFRSPSAFREKKTTCKPAVR